MTRVLLNYTDIPNELPLLPLLVGKEFGSFNLYGDYYRDTYTYSRLQPNMIVDYGINIVNAPPNDLIVDYCEPHSIININQLLVNCGIIKLKSNSKLWDVAIDWCNTIAWCDSSDWAMLNINVKGRQIAGCVCPNKYHEVRDDIITRLKVEFEYLHIDPIFYKPELHWNCTGVPPDLLISCGGYVFSDIVNCEDIVEEW